MFNYSVLLNDPGLGGGVKEYQLFYKKSRRKIAIFQSLNAMNVAKKRAKLEKGLKFGSVTISSVRFEVRVQKLVSIEFEIFKTRLDSSSKKVVRTHV